MNIYLIHTGSWGTGIDLKYICREKPVKGQLDPDIQVTEYNTGDEDPWAGWVHVIHKQCIGGIKILNIVFSGEEAIRSLKRLHAAGHVHAQDVNRMIHLKCNSWSDFRQSPFYIADA